MVVLGRQTFRISIATHDKKLSTQEAAERLPKQAKES